MKKIAIITGLFIASFSFAQNVVSYINKTTNNKVEREKILDAIRKEGKKQTKQEFIFKPYKFNVSSNGYAWIETEIFRKDGKKIQMEEDWMDCCHGEAFLKKTNGQWKVIEAGFFSTDVWWLGSQSKWIKQGAPKAIFK